MVVTANPLERDELPSKVLALKDAVRSFIKPGMVLNLEREANACTAEILRQYVGARPEFTLVIAGVGATLSSLLVHTGLVKKMIFTTTSDFYPAPAPNPVITRAYSQGKLELENWSTLAYTLRLMAGALDVGFMPTKSMLGSSMAEENKDSFTALEDPFGSGRKLGLVKALNPDISVVHGWAADCYGNTITPGFSLTGCWGAKASKQGAVVTVERLVSTRFIREHSHLVRIPGQLVRSVSIVPMGAHPYSMASYVPADFESYEIDADFLSDLRRASDSEERLDAWIKNWMIETADHDGFLRKLGRERKLLLQGKGSQDTRAGGVRWTGAVHLQNKEFNDVEVMIVAAAREVKRLVSTKGYKTLFPGVGASGLAGWVAYYQLQKEGIHVDLIPAGIGFSPQPGDPFMMSLPFTSSATMAADAIDIHGVALSGFSASCLGMVGAGQIDKNGNINSSKLSGKLYLSGAGGGNDIGSGAQEVVVVARQSRKRFVEKVPYITIPGNRVTMLVSDMGVYEKALGDSELMLTHFIRKPGLAPGQLPAEEIRANCGWNLQVDPMIDEIQPPTPDELALLRMLDPNKIFIGQKNA